MSNFDSILVANRGEIALRVMRTAKHLGYRCIAVYSDADKDAPHVMFADSAVHIGNSPAQESYLNADVILQAARQSGAGAVHPGYGFLSENADFVASCEQAGLVFIGPSAEAVALMGNKAEAKRCMLKVGVPCVPGYEGEDQRDSAFLEAAAQLGYPLMLKAAAGGGGRGMSLVSDEAALQTALSSARSIAKASFGSEELILEKAIIEPRHVEVQIFADAHGHVIHLGERDCSVQRRHQKVLEEAPCPVLDEALREKFGSAAVAAASAIEYRGAGTVEFLLDADNSFYFLEMNTRLQVEHPVTEMITGLDLVALQIQVAQGKELGLSQSEVKLKGHAIEARLYAEDSSKGFLPQCGHIKLWQAAEGEGVRVDAGITSDMELSPFYDPMLAKIIAWGGDRQTARLRLIEAIKNTSLIGVANNRRFLVDALEQETFVKGLATTAFIANHFDATALAAVPPADEDILAAGLIKYLLATAAALKASAFVARELIHWSSTGRMSTVYHLLCNEQQYRLCLEPLSAERFRCTLLNSGEVRIADVSLSCDGRLSLKLDGNEIVYRYLAEADVVHIERAHYNWSFSDFVVGPDSDQDLHSGVMRAPMHGNIESVLVVDGESVSEGQKLAVVEAMKMQHDICAPFAGKVCALAVKEGQQVALDELLMKVEAQ